MPLHERKCWECGNVAQHADNVTPEVLCKKCGSQDTRATKRREVSPYESDGHKDRCALIGLSVSRTLDMQDASPKEIEERVDAMGTGLRIIATWASCDSGSQQSRMAAMNDIHKRAMESLGREVESA